MRIFPFCPTGVGSVEYSWKSDIQKTKTSQQRMVLRESPVYEMSFIYEFDANEAGEVYQILTDLYDQPIMVPNWYEFARIKTVNDNQTLFGIDSPVYGFANCKRALLYTDTDFFRVVQLRCAEEQSVELALPLTYYPDSFVYDSFRSSKPFLDRTNLPAKFAAIDHVKQSVIIPLEECLIKGVANFSAKKSGRTELKVTFIKVSPKKYDFTKFEETNPRFYLPKYRNNPVIPFSERYFRKFGERGVDQEVELFDDDIGPVELFVKRTYSESTSSLSIRDMSAYERFSTIKLLYDLKGKAKAFWLPSRVKDYRVVEPFFGMDFSNTCFSVLFDARAGVSVGAFNKGKEALASCLENLRLRASSRNNSLQVVTHSTGTLNRQYTTLNNSVISGAAAEIRSRTQTGAITGAAGAANIASYMASRVAAGQTPVLLVVTDGSVTTSAQVGAILTALAPVINTIRIVTMTYTETQISNLNAFNLSEMDFAKVAPDRAFYGVDPTVSTLKLKVRRLLPQDLIGKSIHLQDINNRLSWSTKIVNCVLDANGFYDVAIDTVAPSAAFALNRTVVSSLEKYCLTSDNVTVKLNDFFESETNLKCARVPE
jgi:hypothetical protein